MKSKTKNIAIFATLVVLCCTHAWASPKLEYQVKAAFLYNFIKFSEWPESKDQSNSDSIIIGILGEDPFDSAFDPVKNQKLKNKSVLIKHFQSLPSYKQSGNDPQYRKLLDSLAACHVLFISRSEADTYADLIPALQASNILTVSEIDGFLNKGGIIQLLMEDNKVRFEINAAAAEKSNIQIRSQLLRLARKVVNK